MRWLFLPILFASLPCGAVTVYKTVDERGHVTFSDQPPADDRPAEILEYAVSTRQPTEAEMARFDAMREVTDRMAADRREREAARAEAYRRRLARQAVPVAEGGYDYYPSYNSYYPVRHRPYRPGFRPHPRRPLLVGQPAIRSQYPAKLIRRHYTGIARRVFNP